MSKSTGISHLALYHYQSCPYCAITRSVVDAVPVDVEFRDIQKVQQHRRTLIQHGGKAQVPCLRIERDGRVEWLYESADIINYLQKQSGSSLAKSA